MEVPKTKMTSSRFVHQLSVKDLLESAGGLTFRKTFTPSVPSPIVADSGASPSTTASKTSAADNEKSTIFSRLCELFGKEAQYMQEVYRCDNPALAAADILGYTYETTANNKTRKKDTQVEKAKQDPPPPPPPPPPKKKKRKINSAPSVACEETEEKKSVAVADERQIVRERLMKDLKEKIAQRRRDIILQRQELFENPLAIDLNLEEGKDDLWKAVPVLADPDNLDSSFEAEEVQSQSGTEASCRGEMEENREWPFATESCVQLEMVDGSSSPSLPPSSPSEASEFQTVDLNQADTRLPLAIAGTWDPDAAFSEVERILASLEHGRRSPSVPQDESHYDRPKTRRMNYLNDPRSEEDRHSDDSGMSSSADTSNSGREEVGKSLLYSIVSSKPQAKPVRKTKQQQQVATIAIDDSHESTGNPCRNDPKVEVGWSTQVEANKKQTSQISHHLHDSHIYSIAHDSPIIIDTVDYGGDLDSESRIRIDLRSETASITSAKIARAAALGLVEDDNFTYDNDNYGRAPLRNRCESLTNSAGEIFGSIRSNLSNTVYTTHEALQRIGANVGNAVRPIADTINEAGTELISELNRAAEPLVQHLQLLSTRLQVRYIHATQQNQWLPKLPLMRDACDWVEDIPKSQNGFEELRLHVKEGGDLCKELSAILHERSELEASYAKGMAKLASKLLKTTGDLQGPHGTVTSAWASVATEMDSEAELHKALSVSLSEELVKPLKLLIESQHRIRKTVEAGVDKTGRVLAEWRSAQAKAKKQCYLSARDNEKMQDQIYSDARLGKPRTLSDKETAKIEAKCKKTEETVRKAEGEYYTCCVRAERSRMEWESATQRGSRCFHALEHERLTQLKDLVSKYHHCLREYGPKLCQSVERLAEPVASCNVEGDLQRVATLRESAPTYSEQLLPDFYAEHMSNVINRERRKESLERCLNWVRSDVEREARGKRGVENLARALQDTPTFGGEESQLEVTEKLHHLKAMLAFLEMTKVKLHNALCELEPNRLQKVDHPLFKYLEVHKDKQGLMQSILKLPHWIDNDEIEIEYPEDRGAADGTSGLPDSDFDEFSSQDSDGECSSRHSVVQCNSNNGSAKKTSPDPPAAANPAPSVGKCRALYSYSANMYDELSIQPGDMINIHDKQADGWWLGELDGTVGIFPATYVEEI